MEPIVERELTDAEIAARRLEVAGKEKAELKKLLRGSETVTIIGNKAREIKYGRGLGVIPQVVVPPELQYSKARDIQKYVKGRFDEQIRIARIHELAGILAKALNQGVSLFVASGNAVVVNHILRKTV